MFGLVFLAGVDVLVGFMSTRRMVLSPMGLPHYWYNIFLYVPCGSNQAPSEQDTARYVQA
jgi:hypothetical protein